MRKLTHKYLSKFEELVFWLGLCDLVFFVLYQKFPLFELTGMFVSIRLEDFLVFSTILLVAFYAFVSGRWKISFENRISQSVLLFWFVGLLSSYSAIFLVKVVSFPAVILHFLRRVELLSLLFWGIVIPIDKRRFFLFFLTLFISLLSVNFYALGQVYFHFPSISTVNTELSKGKIVYLASGQRVNSTFAGHYDLAVFLVMTMLLLASFIIYMLHLARENKKIFFVLFVLIFTFGLSFYVFLLTAARLSFLAFLGGTISLLFLLGKKRFILFPILVFLLILVYPSQLRDRLLLTIKVNIAREWNSFSALNKEQEKRSKLNIPTLPSSGERIDVGGGLPADVVPGEPVNIAELAVYRSFEIRTQVEWPRAWRAFLRNPLLGSGYSSVGLATDNDLLRLLAEVGLLGFLSFFLIIFLILRKLIYLLKSAGDFEKYYISGIISLLLAFLFNSLLIDVFEASKIASLLWLLLGLTFGYIECSLKDFKGYEKKV